MWGREELWMCVCVVIDVVGVLMTMQQDGRLKQRGLRRRCLRLAKRSVTRKDSGCGVVGWGVVPLSSTMNRYRLLRTRQDEQDKMRVQVQGALCRERRKMFGRGWDEGKRLNRASLCGKKNQSRGSTAL